MIVWWWATPELFDSFKSLSSLIFWYWTLLINSQHHPVHKFEIISSDRLPLIIGTIMFLAKQTRKLQGAQFQDSTESLSTCMCTSRHFLWSKYNKKNNCYQFSGSPSEFVSHFLGVHWSLIQRKLASHLFHDVIFKFNFLHELSLNLFSKSCDFILL